MGNRFSGCKDFSLISPFKRLGIMIPQWYNMLLVNGHGNLSVLYAIIQDNLGDVDRFLQQAALYISILKIKDPKNGQKTRPMK
ncbi:MAG: hypothetical protein QMC95_15280, partial [Desulfitobacteriaceae bacterium]|nr:hypothetical protein [Desulfitobacteriaceae bacterium]